MACYNYSARPSRREGCLDPTCKTADDIISALAELSYDMENCRQPTSLLHNWEYSSVRWEEVVNCTERFDGYITGHNACMPSSMTEALVLVLPLPSICLGRRVL